MNFERDQERRQQQLPQNEALNPFKSNLAPDIGSSAYTGQPLSQFQQQQQFSQQPGSNISSSAGNIASASANIPRSSEADSWSNISQASSQPQFDSDLSNLQGSRFDDQRQPLLQQQEHRTAPLVQKMVGKLERHFQADSNLPEESLRQEPRFGSALRHSEQAQPISQSLQSDSNFGKFRPDSTEARFQAAPFVHDEPRFRRPDLSREDWQQQDLHQRGWNVEPATDVGRSDVNYRPSEIAQLSHRSADWKPNYDVERDSNRFIDRESESGLRQRQGFRPDLQQDIKQEFKQDTRGSLPAPRAFARAPLKRRFFAHAIDLGLVLGIWMLYNTLSAMSSWMWGSHAAAKATVAAAAPRSVGLVWTLFGAGYMAWRMAFWPMLYELSACRLFGTTIGKNLMGIDVVQRGSHANPTFKQSFIRSFIDSGLMWLLPPLPYLNKNRITLSDWASDTEVTLDPTHPGKEITFSSLRADISSYARDLPRLWRDIKFQAKRFFQRLNFYKDRAQHQAEIAVDSAKNKIGAMTADRPRDQFGQQTQTDTLTHRITDNASHLAHVAAEQAAVMKDRVVGTASHLADRAKETVHHWREDQASDIPHESQAKSVLNRIADQATAAKDAVVDTASSLAGRAKEKVRDITEDRPQQTFQSEQIERPEGTSYTEAIPAQTLTAATIPVAPVQPTYSSMAARPVSGPYYHRVEVTALPQEASPSPASRITEKASDIAASAKLKANELGETTKLKADELSESAKLKANELSESAKQQVPVVKEKAAELYDRTKEQAYIAKDKVTEKSADLYARAKEQTPVVKEKAAELYERAKEQAVIAKDKIVETASDLYGRAKEQAPVVKEKAAELYDKTKVQAAAAKEKVQEKAGDLAARAKQPTTSDTTYAQAPVEYVSAPEAVIVPAVVTAEVPVVVQQEAVVKESPIITTTQKPGSSNVIVTERVQPRYTEQM